MRGATLLKAFLNTCIALCTENSGSVSSFYLNASLGWNEQRKLMSDQRSALQAEIRNGSESGLPTWIGKVLAPLF